MEKMMWVITILSFLLIGMSIGTWADTVAFSEAKPIWLKNRAKEMNDFAGFRAIFNVDDVENVFLRCAGHDFYRVHVNGKFVLYGPARGPHGFHRMDEINISKYLQKGENIIAIEVIVYNVNGYGITNQPGFIQAEVVQGKKVLCATGSDKNPFMGFDLNYKFKKVERYSFQRGFTEAYHFTPQSLIWIMKKENAPTPYEVEIQENKALIPRRVPMPNFEIIPPEKIIIEGKVNLQKPIEKPWINRSVEPRADFLGYPFDQLEYSPPKDFQQMTIEKGEQKEQTANFPLLINASTYNIFDFGRSMTGFVCLKIKVDEPTKVFITFDEMLRNETVDWKRLGCHNVIALHLSEKGEYNFESIEPYTFRYMQVSNTNTSSTIVSTGIRLYENPEAQKAKFVCSDDRLNRIFEAGRATFAQNAVDIFMDCPHRERAGWLCDSFFTSRAGLVLTGNTSVEKNFFENFMLPPKFEFLPDGMLPMCYPSDHNNGQFIPNWAMWFVIQLGEYAKRSNDWDLVNALKPKVLALVKFFDAYKNSDGLLEKLPSWVFVEWSKANDFVQDVNYPSNMLFAGVLDTVAELYNLPEYKQEAEKIRETVRKQSFDGTFFVDNAVRKDGKLEVTKNRTEVCQYFAFFFKVATRETHPDLWNIIRNDFGPHRKEKDKNKYPEIYLANSFIGNVLRAELLTMSGEGDKVLDESVGYLDYMAQRTGTLWENVDDGASLNHGFASHVVYIYDRVALGISEFDPVNKRIKVVFRPLSLKYCEGEIPVGDNQSIKMRWEQDDNAIKYRLSVPQGFTVEVENLTSKNLVKESS